MNAPAARVVSLTAGQLTERIEDALNVQANAMRYPREIARTAAPVWTAHMNQDGWRCYAAVTPGDELVGIGYGLPELRGQFWHDSVLDAVVAQDGTAVAQKWMTSCFRVVELHVRRQWQGRGLGRTMMESMLTGLPHLSAVLCTPERQGRAWTLYQNLGFGDLLRNHRFPDDPRPYAVLGRQL